VMGVTSSWGWVSPAGPWGAYCSASEMAKINFPVTGAQIVDFRVRDDEGFGRFDRFGEVERSGSATRGEAYDEGEGCCISAARAPGHTR
jgi:hypothetical protein